MKKNYSIRILSGSPLTGYMLKMDFAASNYDEFKEAFLKRFGNFSGTRRSNEDKPKLKKLIKDTNSEEEFKKVFSEIISFNLVYFKS